MTDRPRAPAMIAVAAAQKSQNNSTILLPQFLAEDTADCFGARGGIWLLADPSVEGGEFVGL